MGIRRDWWEGGLIKNHLPRGNTLKKGDYKKKKKSSEGSGREKWEEWLWIQNLVHH